MSLLLFTNIISFFLSFIYSFPYLAIQIFIYLFISFHILGFIIPIGLFLAFFRLRFWGKVNMVFEPPSMLNTGRKFSYWALRESQTPCPFCPKPMLRISLFSNSVFWSPHLSYCESIEANWRSSPWGFWVLKAQGKFSLGISRLSLRTLSERGYFFLFSNKMGISFWILLEKIFLLILYWASSEAHENGSHHSCSISKSSFDKLIGCCMGDVDHFHGFHLMVNTNMQNVVLIIEESNQKCSSSPPIFDLKRVFWIRNVVHKWIVIS